MADNPYSPLCWLILTSVFFVLDGFQVEKLKVKVEAKVKCLLIRASQLLHVLESLEAVQ